MASGVEADLAPCPLRVTALIESRSGQNLKPVLLDDAEQFERVPEGTALYLRCAPTEPPMGVSALSVDDRSRGRPKARTWPPAKPARIFV
jgi:hypothetical protein